MKKNKMRDGGGPVDPQHSKESADYMFPISEGKYWYLCLKPSSPDDFLDDETLADLAIATVNLRDQTVVAVSMILTDQIAEIYTSSQPGSDLHIITLGEHPETGHEFWLVVKNRKGDIRVFADNPLKGFAQSAIPSALLENFFMKRDVTNDYVKGF